MMEVKRVHSIGSFTGIVDAFLVYGRYFTRCAFWDARSNSEKYGYYIYIAKDFDPAICSNLFKKMSLCNSIFIDEGIKSEEEFIEICNRDYGKKTKGV